MAAPKVTCAKEAASPWSCLFVAYFINMRICPICAYEANLG